MFCNQLNHCSSLLESVGVSKGSSKISSLALACVRMAGPLHTTEVVFRVVSVKEFRKFEVLDVNLNFGRKFVGDSVAGLAQRGLLQVRPSMVCPPISHVPVM